MYKKYLALIVAAAMLTAFSGCKKDSDKTDDKNSTDSQITSVATAQESLAVGTSDTPDSPDKPKKVLSPYDYPYDTEKIKADLIAYGEELGLYYDDTVTMKTATSITNNQTRAAANGKVLEKWCKKDLDSIEKLAAYQNYDIEEIGFNIIVYDSPDYDGEYIIGIYAEN